MTADQTQFLALLTGPHTFQTFDDRPGKDRTLSRILHDPSRLADLNRRGAGVFVMINEGDGEGRDKSNVTRIRAYFADFDGASLPTVWTLPPCLTVETSLGKFHVYWILREGEAAPLDNAAFNRQQEAIARAIGSQPNDCKGLNRVMRVPGYLHQKGEPFMSRIVSTTAERFTLEQIAAAYQVPMMASAHERPTRPFEGAQPGMVGARRRYALKVLYSLANELGGTLEGRRNTRLNAVSFKVGRLIGGGHLERGEVEGELIQAGQRMGLPPAEITATLDNGLKAGIADPDALEHIGGAGFRVRRQVHLTTHHTISPSGEMKASPIASPHQSSVFGGVVKVGLVEALLGKHRAKLAKKLGGRR